MKSIRRAVAFLAYYLRYWPKYLRQAQRLRNVDPLRFIYVDVSIIFRHDSGTGIQRVVRALMAHLIAEPPEGCRIVPVVATKHRPYRAIGIDDWHASGQDALKSASAIVPREGDVFLGLELSTHLIPRHALQFRWFQSRGAKILLFLYDMLPDQSPQYFTMANVKKFRPWLDFLLSQADGAICISQTVAHQLRQKLLTSQPRRKRELDINAVPMGGDIVNSALGGGMTADQAGFLETAGTIGKTILMVGTLEPRKAYDVALDALECVWRQREGDDVRLVIAGRHGWQSNRLEQRLADHPEKNRRLFRFDNVSDEYLETLYQRSSGLLMTSYAEGFGLPVLEALQNGLPVLARDLPVFRELQQGNIHYFQNDAPHLLGHVILAWLENTAAHPVPASISGLTWRNTGLALADILERQ